MPRKRHKPEEIVAVRRTRQVDVLVSQGKSVADAVRAIGVTEVTYCRWRSEPRAASRLHRPYPV
jgi:transposase